MTVESTTRRAQYDTNGTTGPWTVPFYFLADADLSVYYTDADGNETELTLTTHYSVTGAGVPAGGTVTTVASYAAGGTITILRNVELLQETDYVETDAFPAASHEAALDRLTMIAQQQAEVLDRALLFPPSDQNSGVLPSAASRANTTLGFDSDGAPTVLTPTSGSAADVLTRLADTADSAKGAALVGYNASLAYAGDTVGKKLQEWRSAYDDGARGVSTVVDSAAIQAGCDLIDAAGGGVYRINSFVATSINLAALSLPATVQIIDDRYSSSGWSVTHNEGDDAQVGLRGRATAAGEGPSFVLQNLASSGNRNVSFVHWYGPTNSPVVASFEHWGYNSDSTWYAGREWLSKGSIDTGARARTRQGNDGGMIFNPNGSALSYRNNPASAFTAGYHFVFGAPLQSGYTYSSKLLFALHNTHADFPVELRLQPDTGESGASVANPTLRFQTGVGSGGTNRFSIIGEYPSTGLLTIRDDVNGVDLITFALNGSTIGFGTAIAAGSVLNNTLFRDAADNKLKYKDNGGVVNALY